MINLNNLILFKKLKGSYDEYLMEILVAKPLIERERIRVAAENLIRG